MSNVIFTPPPLYNSIITENNQLDPSWAKWFSNIYSVLNQFFPNVGVGGNSIYTSLIAIPNFNTANRDNLTNLNNGYLIYNIDTNQLNLYSDGNWIIIS